ncbi:hypothetical protein DLAC_06541 [Tieghemostelium lacteum]|uniref:Uncharacterized protein n=1 Tax=Tieghemostelium lacteum TaxID=361077 RepID=A0A151ZFA6_TIELA|nr:hypothetical protein DLAC_06541 [Tieghemostelium lacteum]|eukprot:KYQ92550.1 hypothetical protein DLAC_06541 [Tieghemostelium lacteum]
MDHLSDNIKGSLKDVGSMIPISVQSKEKSKRLRDQVKDLQTKNKNLEHVEHVYKNKIDEESSVSKMLQQEATILKQYISDKDTEISGLNQQIKEHSATIVQIRNEKDNKEKELEKLHQQLQIKESMEIKLNQELTQLGHQLDTEQQRVQQLKIQHNEDELKYHAELHERQQVIQKLSEQLEEKENTIHQLKDEMEQAQKMQLKLSDEIQEFQLTVNSLSQKNQNQAVEIKDLQELLNECKDSLSKQTDLYVELKSVSDGDKVLLNEVQEKFSNSQQSLQQEQFNVQQLQSDQKKLESDMIELKQVVNQLQQELSIKTSQNDELFQIRNNLNLEIECVRKSHLKEMEELTGQLDLQKEKSQSDQQELSVKSQELEKLTENNQNLLKEIQELKEKNESYQQEKQHLQDREKELDEKLQDVDSQLTKVSRQLEKVEFERDSLKSDNDSIKTLLNQSAETDPNLGEAIKEQDRLQKENQTLTLSVMEKNNIIEDKERDNQQLHDQIVKLQEEIQQLTDQLSKQAENHNNHSEEFQKKMETLQLDHSAVLEKSSLELQQQITQLQEEKESQQKEANNLAQRLNHEIDKTHDLEVQIKHYQKELESTNSTRDNLIKEIQELQESKLLDGANKEMEGKLQKEFNDFKSKSTEEFDKINQERSQWEQTKKDIQNQLVEEKNKVIEEKNKSKSIQDQLTEEKRVVGVIEKIVTKLLADNENQKFESMSPESFYAMLDSVKKEITDGLASRRKYYDDEDIMGQLLMEREARRLAESQVMIVLEKSKQEINKYKEIIQNGGANQQNKGNFFSNLFNSSNNSNSNNNNNLLKRTFTGTTYNNKK